MKVELKTLQAKVGTTFVYITHDQSEALVMSDRIAVMNKGRYEQIGTPQELYGKPATPLWPSLSVIIIAGAESSASRMVNQSY